MPSRTTPARPSWAPSSGLAFANGTLFVVDANLVGAAPVNNRVLIFSNLAATPGAQRGPLQYNTLVPGLRGTRHPGSGPADLRQHSAGALHHAARRP